MVHLNIHYLFPKIDELKLLCLKDNSIDILCLCETFLNNSISDSQIHLEGYSIFRRDRPSNGGGLVIYVKDTIHCVRRNDYEDDSLEILCLEIRFPRSRPFLISYTYRPPSSTVEWFNQFYTCIEKACNGQLECISLGDFNIDILKCTHQAKTWIQTMESYGFTQLVDVATRVSETSSTLIDQVFSNCPHNISSVHVPVFAISDHYPVCISRKINRMPNKAHSHKLITYRCLKRFDENMFIHDLSLQPWNNLLALGDPDLSMSSFIEIFSNVLSRHAPLKTKRVKREIQPDWMNKEIADAMAMRDIFCRNQNKSQFKIWRNKVKTLIRSSKLKVYDCTINQNKRDPKRLWKSMNNLTGINNRSETHFIEDENGKLVSNADLSSNLFNDYFCDISNIVHTRSLDYNENTFLKFESNSIFSCKIGNVLPFKIPSISLQFVLKQLQSLDITKATGIDGLSGRFIKIASFVIAPVLTYIFNQSIATNQFPTCFKIAKVLPIHKSGSKVKKENYRPISILPIISLILERHVSIHLRNFLENNNLLYNRQSGFRPKHSCQTALAQLIDDWLLALDKNEYVGSVFLDLSKAFDLVDHTILLKKLRAYRFSERSLLWFSSYLNNRSQVTHFLGSKSRQGHVKTGVPQGSVLGPLLFLIYINDLPLSLNGTVADIFADDTTISTSGINLETITAALNNDIDNVQNWCKNNKMALNLSKTKGMIISSTYKSHSLNTASVSLYCGNENIVITSSERLLGVTVDSTLSWDAHISAILKKCNSYLFLLSRIKPYLSISSRKLFYNAYILPHFDYCCIVWGNCRTSLEESIVRFQKRAARLILDIHDINTPSEFLFETLQWMTFPERVIYQKAILMFKIINNLAPSYLLNSLTFTSDIHSKELRSSNTNQIYMPKPMKESFRKSLLYSGSNIWNLLPLNIRNANSINQFKALYLKWKYDR